MDYEKMYKETLERAKIWQEHLNEAGDKDFADELNYIFPELKESEDEKIRKMIINQMERWHKAALENNAVQDIKDSADAITWLEKQGSNLVKNGYTNNKDVIEYASNYSREIWHKLMDNFKNIKDYHIGCNDVSDIVLNAIINTYNWLEKQDKQKHIEKDLEMVNPSDKAEQKPTWSEEDEKMKDLIISVLEVNHSKGIFKAGLRAIRTEEIVSWLKSIKQRYTWKPSDGQMKALEHFIIHHNGSTNYAKDLEELRIQLKKLKGE